MSKKYEGKYIVRCDRAGVFYGEIEGVDGNVVSMRKVRKLWMWSGAAAVEQLAKEGPHPGSQSLEQRVDLKQRDLSYLPSLLL